MPTIHCPGCNRVLSLPYEDMAVIIQCVRCQTAFEPLTGKTVPLRKATTKPPPPESFGFRCPFCACSYPPAVKSQITLAGWYLFVVLLGSCIFIPLCWIPLLLLRKDYRHCTSCGIRLDNS